MPGSRARQDKPNLRDNSDAKRQAEVSSDSAVASEAGTYSAELLNGGDFSQAAFENHISLLSDSRLSQPANAQRRALIVRQIQRDYGNQYVQRLVNRIQDNQPQAVQTSLTVGPAGDEYEREADRVAKQVVGMSQPVQKQGPEEELQMKPLRRQVEEEELRAKVLQRQDEDEELQAKILQRQDEEEELQMSAVAQRQIGAEGGDVEPDLEQSVEGARGNGQALPDNMRTSMEGAFGADFSGVKVHTDSESNSLNESLQARAFTTGNDIFFKQGEYQPGISSGREVLAHELTHVVQQNGGAVARKTDAAQPGLVQRDDVTAVEEAEPETAKKSGGFFGRIGKAFKKATKAVAGAVTRGIKAVGSAAKSAASEIVEAAKSVGGAIASTAQKVGETLIEAAVATGKAAKTAAEKSVATTKELGSKIADAAKATGEAAVDAAKAIVKGIADGAGWVGGKLKGFGKIIYTSDFAELDATQYRVTTGRKVEKIIRQEDEDGKPVYFAVGEVTSFEGNKPVVENYDEPVNLGDWYPKVTHINGMTVKPKSGLKSAEMLYKAIHEELEDQEVALEADVLYTYSAHRGIVTDMLECIKGKLYIGDDATKVQEQIILDAVRGEKRTTVSAHSRGTIKTDNAIRNAYKILKEETHQKLLTDTDVKANAEKAATEWAQSMEAKLGADAAGLDTSVFVDIYTKEYSKLAAGRKTSEAMDKYIQLIYAGNAVQFPSSVLKGDLIVAKKDPVSLVFGKFFKGAAKWFGSRMDMTKVKGGHGFVTNYAEEVGSKIAQDLVDRANEEGV